MKKMKERHFLGFITNSHKKMEDEERAIKACIASGTFLPGMTKFFSIDNFTDTLNSFHKSFRDIDVELIDFYKNEGNNYTYDYTAFVIQREYGVFIGKVGSNELTFNEKMPAEKYHASVRFKYSINNDTFASCLLYRNQIMVSATYREYKNGSTEALAIYGDNYKPLKSFFI